MADDARTIRQDLNKANRLARQAAQTATDLAAQVAAADARIQRAGIPVAGPFPVGSVDVTVSWPLAWSDAGYGVWVAIISGTAALGALTATLKSGTKTSTDCVITVANTGAGPVGAFALDVLGVHT